MTTGRATITTAAWICIHDRRLLLVKPYRQLTYIMPGGKVESGETKRGALLREIGEELDCQLRPESLREFATFKAPAAGELPSVQVSVTCYFAEPRGRIRASGEIEDCRFFSRTDYAALAERAPAVLAVFAALHHLGLVD